MLNFWNHTKGGARQKRDHKEWLKTLGELQFIWHSLRKVGSTLTK